MNIAINTFIERQLNTTQDSKLGGFTGNADEFIKLLSKYDFDKEAQDGFAPFVKLLEVHAEDLGLFLGTFREAKDGEGIVTRMEARRDGENPVPVKYILGDKEPPEAARIVFYSHAQLEADKEKVTEGSDWEAVSINMGPADEPIQPVTMLRNWAATWYPESPDARGGSPHYKKTSHEEFIKLLANSMLYWANRGRVVRKLP